MTANQNDYLDLAEYRGKTAGEGGIATFEHADGRFYFAVLDAAGAVLLRSEGYPSKAARDNGAAAIGRNRANAARHGVIHEGDAYYAVLKAGNHQEIGRSGPCASEAEARAIGAALLGGAAKSGSSQAPRAAAAPRPAAAGSLRVTQLKSTYGELRRIICSVKGLGLRRRHHSVLVADTKENRGMIRAAIHLLKVEEAK